MICLAEDGYANRLDLECYRQAAHDRWQDDIAELGARDASESYPDDAVLFIGSSSIRLWSDIAADMQPYPVIQRGYGGAKWSDVAIFIDQLVRPHSCCAVVFFVGTAASKGADLLVEHMRRERRGGRTRWSRALWAAAGCPRPRRAPSPPPTTGWCARLSLLLCVPRGSFPC